MVEKRSAISIEEAIQRVMVEGIKGSTETVPLTSAHNRFLAIDIFANQDVPAFDRSLYDGFAIRVEDTTQADGASPIVFEVICEIGAGHVFSGKVGNFQAVRIMTGAQMPNDCNAVVMLEDVRSFEESGKKYMIIQRQIPSGQHVFRKGAEIEEGTCMVKQGTLITPGVVGLLATFGYNEVLVGKKPVVGVLATGSELLDIHEPLAPGKIRNSNSYMILSQIERVGGEAVYLGKLDDELESCLTAVQEALSKVDILITTGGVSVGDYDHLPEIYQRLGATVLFNKIAMRPGSVTTVAKLGNQLLFGLSGNPSASFIGFELFVRPIIRKALCNNQTHLASIKAVLLEDYLVPNAYAQLIRTKISYEDAKVYVSSTGLNMSNSITSIAGATALLLLPPSSEGYKKGSIVDVLLLTEQDGQLAVEGGFA